MFTLEDVASRLETGATGAKRTGAFVEPMSGPGSVPGVTLDEVMASFDIDGTEDDGLVFWQTALDFVMALNAGTVDCGDESNAGSHQTDWRLPGVRELHSLINYGFFIPALSNAAGTAAATDGDPFAGDELDLLNDYWSSTTQKGFSTTFAWGVAMSSGAVFDRSKTTDTLLVWPVRGGS